MHYLRCYIQATATPNVAPKIKRISGNSLDETQEWNENERNDLYFANIWRIR